MSLAAAAPATGLGVLVSALVRTEAQAGGLTVLLPCSSCCPPYGVFRPFIMPNWLQALGLLTPQAWALEAYRDQVGVLAGFAGAFFLLGLWRP